MAYDGGNKRFYGAARDVTEIAHLQQQMQLLSRFISRTVLFMTVKEDNYSFEVVAHGLEKEMGISRAEMENELNSARFYKRLIPKTESILWKIGFKSIETKQSTSQSFRMMGADGQPLNIVVDADFVDDQLSDVKCILSLRLLKD